MYSITSISESPQSEPLIESEQVSNFVEYGFDKCTLLSISEEWYIKRISEGFSGEGLEGRTLPETFEEFSELKPARSCAAQIPFSAAYTAVRSIIQGKDTIRRVLDGGPGNCFDWAIVMQLVAKHQYPDSDVLIMPYNANENSEGPFHDHYGVVINEKDASGYSTIKYAVFGGLNLTDLDLTSDLGALNKIKSYLLEDFKGDEATLNSKANKLLGYFKMMQANYYTGSGPIPSAPSDSLQDQESGHYYPEENIERLFESAKGNPTATTNLKNRFPSYNPQEVVPAQNSI